METVTENKNIFDNIDKILVTENKLLFRNNVKNIEQKFTLTDDGIVEHYINNNLENTFPFSKLSIARECKLLVQEGYCSITDKIEEAEIDTIEDTNKEKVLQDPDKIKQDIQDQIDQVDEIQQKQDELNDKLDDLLEESKPTERFPSTDFSNEPVLYQDLDVETFNKELTAEQKAYINTYLGTIEEFVDAMLLLYNEVGNGIDPMISVDDYVEELLNNDGITEWSQELADMLRFDLKTEDNGFGDTSYNQSLRYKSWRYVK